MPKDCYCEEASKRFPHLTDGSNRGVKPDDGTPMPSPEVDKAYQKQREGEREFAGMDINPWMTRKGFDQAYDQTGGRRRMLDRMHERLKTQKEKQ